MRRPLLLTFALVMSSPACGGGEHASTSGTGGSGATTTSSTTTSSATTSASAGGTGGGVPACTLTESGPIVVTADNQVIEDVHVVSTSGAAITVEGHKGVVIRNVRIEHAGGPGIDASGADDLVIDGVSIEHTGAPPSGANPSSDLVNISCYGSTNVSITRARLTRGSSGVYLLQCPAAKLSFLEGHDMRGPFPRGQLVQWDKSDDGVLEDFSMENPATSWPEDNVNVYQSVNVQIRRGLVDGNNSPSGVGVIFDGDTGAGVVEDVDAVHMGNGCFSDYGGADGVIFRRTRCRDNICTDQGRGLPSSNALMWAGHPGYSQIRLETSNYFDACNPGNIVWPADSFAVVDVTEQDFTLRAPIRVKLCWE
jgi:hypothetical protein